MTKCVKIFSNLATVCSVVPFGQSELTIWQLMTRRVIPARSYWTERKWWTHGIVVVQPDDSLAVVIAELVDLCEWDAEGGVPGDAVRTPGRASPSFPHSLYCLATNGHRSPRHSQSVHSFPDCLPTSPMNSSIPCAQAEKLS
jgi:hypothetical protein